MSFTAKVKATADLFQATNEWEENEFIGRDAHEPVEGHVYFGHHFIAASLVKKPDGRAVYTYASLEFATFKAEELDVLSGYDIRLLRR